MVSTEISDYNPMELVFGVAEELAEGMRHPEDGEPLIDSAFFVSAVAPNGVRWYREVGTAIWVSAGTSEFGDPMVRRTQHPENLREKAEIVADRLMDSKTRRLNTEVWFYVGAVYGSPAYDSLGIEQDTIEWERRENERF